MSSITRGFVADYVRAGFTRIDFGGNTIWLVRDNGATVDILTAADDSFPPAASDDDAMMARVDASVFAAWQSGEVEGIDSVEAVVEWRGTAAELLAIDGGAR